ncbi:hypothetical protein CaCOL14_008274 [Colletotrichum acutatum]
MTPDSVLSRASARLPPPLIQKSLPRRIVAPVFAAVIGSSLRS